MAKIPTAEEELPQPIVNPASPTQILDKSDERAFRAPAEATDQLGTQITSLGATLKANQDQADEYEARKRFVDFDLQQDQKLNQAKRDAPDNPEGFTKTVRQSYDADAKNFFKDLPDSQKPKYDYLLTNRGAQYESNAQSFEEQQRDAYVIKDLDASTQNLRNATAQNPASLKDNIARGAFLIDGSNLPFQAKEKAKKAFVSQIAEDAIRARVSNGEDPEAIIKDIESAPSNPSTGSIGDSTAPDFRGHQDVASIRYNNPGAMWPGDSATKFGAVDTVNLKDGQGNKIAVFPDAVSGAAAQFDLIASKYANKPLGAIVSKWSGGNSVKTYLGVIQRETGLSANTVITDDMLKNPDIAIPLAKAMAMQEAGKPYPMNDSEWRAGFNKANGIEDKESVKVAELADGAKGDATEGEAARADMKDDADLADPNIMNSPYRFLSPVQRRTLINVVRTTGRADAMDKIDNDIAQIRNTGNPTLRPDGRTSLEAAQKLLTPQQYKTASDKWHEAQLYHEATAPLANLSESDARDHIAEMAPHDGASDYAIRDKVAKEANRTLDKIVQARKKDPALSVEQTPEVQDAFKEIADLRKAPNAVDGGTVDVAGLTPPQKANQTLIDARIAAQRRLGIDESNISPITKNEAAALFKGQDLGKLSDIELPKALRDARDLADAKYGPYAKQVFEHALGMVSKSDKVKSAGAPIIRKMLDGEPIEPTDYRNAAALSRASGSDILFDPSAGMRAMTTTGPVPTTGFHRQSPDVAGGFFGGGSSPRDGAFNTAKPATPFNTEGNAGSKHVATPEAISYLKSNPSTWQQFEALFGPGSAAAALRQ